ncbi:hypothetical protein Taro_030782 [Colocasia esculenta]|uniref:Uncharacterized protein n=1 Tax=Colocasia esculenta TaxID=4460 RepID=A0A843VX44_COLES|nr:hypothetical protein [Colocasia esculenta]
MLLFWLVRFGWFSQNCALVVLVEVVHSSEGSSQDHPLSLLVEVLLRSAFCSFRASVVLPLWFKVCRLVGLHSSEVALLFISEFLGCAGGTFCVPVVQVVCFVSRTLRALPDGGLILVNLIPHSEEEWLLSGMEISTKVDDGEEEEQEEEEEAGEQEREGQGGE